MNDTAKVIAMNSVQEPESEPDHVTRARCKVLQLSRRDLLHLLANYRGSLPDCITIPDFPELPADAVIEDVHFDPMTRCFALRVWSSEFSPVPDGGMMPKINDPMGMTFRAIQLTDEQKEQMK
jgi:hypothetical protein